MFKTVKICVIGLGAVLLLTAGSLPLRAQTETDSSNEQQTERQEIETQCQRRQQAVDRRANGIEMLTTRQLEFLNGGFERLQNYVDKNNVEVSNYQALKNKVNDAQAAAIDAINALKHGSPQLNCQSSDHRSDIKGYKDRARAAIEALKDYRQALRDLLKAAREAGGELR